MTRFLAPWRRRRSSRKDSLDAVNAKAGGPNGATQASIDPPEPEPEDNTLQILMRLRRFARPQRWSIIVAFAMMLGTIAMDLLKPWPLKFALDAVLHEGPVTERTVYLLLMIAALVVATAVFEGLFSYAQTYFINRAGRGMTFDIRSSLFDHIQRLSLQYHSRKRTGDLLARVTSDVKAINEALTESLLQVVSGIFLLLGMVGVLFWLDWQLALIAVGAAPVLLLVFFTYTKKIRSFSRAERKREGALASVMHETLGAIRLTKVFSHEEETRKRFQAESAASLESGFAANLADERLSWVVDVLGALLTAAVLGYGAYRSMQGELSVSELVVFFTYVRTFYKPARTVAKHANKITKVMAKAERVVNLLDIEEGVTDRPGAQPAPRFRGEIEFGNVAFEYEPGVPVLSAVNLRIPAGSVTAVVGPTGAGKTTLVSLIPRLYDPSEGSVRIDGRDVREYTLQSLRSQISMVLQESVLFRTTIAENIGYGRPGAPFEEVVAAARAAYAHDFILELPDGYDTEIGERGDTLSGGQRQRIAIARAIIRDAPIAILDEPLVGLDAEAAALVMEALERLMRGKTVLIITHQLSTAERADRTVVLDDGRIVQAHGRELVERTSTPQPARLSVTDGGK